jgi:hypothetical protein
LANLQDAAAAADSAGYVATDNECSDASVSDQSLEGDEDDMGADDVSEAKWRRRRVAYESQEGEWGRRRVPFESQRDESIITNIRLSTIW